MKLAGLFKKLIKNSTKSLLIKVFIVCTATSLFTVAIMGTYTYYYILKNLDNEIEKYEKKKLNETLNISKIQLGEMQKLIVNYAMNNKYTQFAYMPRDIINLKYQEIQNIQDYISNTINSSNYIENIFFYYEKDNYVLDYSGMTSLSTYYDNGWHQFYDDMTDSSLILNTRRVINRTGGSNDRYNNIITFITRIPYVNSVKDGAIVLNVDVKIISDLLKNITAGDEHALAFLVNENGEILSSNNEIFCYQNIYDLLKIPPSSLDTTGGNFKFTMDGVKMISYFETFPINNWKLLYMESEDVIFKKSAYIKYITLITFSILLLFTAAISFIFSFKVYMPIKKIITNIKSMTAVNDEDISDISMIHGSLNLLFENNKTLEKQIQQNELLMREVFLSQLITGKLFNKNEVRSKVEYFSIDLEFDYIKIAVIQNNSAFSRPFDVEKSEHDKISLINMVANVFKALNLDVICSQDLNDNILVLIKLSSIKDVNETEAIIEQTLEDINYNIEEYLELSTCIGIGGIYKDLSDIGVSYTEAVKALHYKYLKGDNSVINYADISKSEKEKLYYPVENEQKLLALIKQCDYENTIIFLSYMLDDIISHNNNFDNMEVCLSNMVGIIQRCIYELNLNKQEVFGEDSVVNVSIDSFKNIQQFSDWISDKFRKIIEYQIGQQKDNMNSFGMEISEYLNKVYTEEISLASVAKHFNYNSSYFCKIFKEKMNISFWEYVAKTRIESSKKLLLETENTIEQIADMVGYNNRFSYIRTFKKLTSITPSEYRLKNAR